MTQLIQLSLSRDYNMFRYAPKKDWESIKSL